MSDATITGVEALDQALDEFCDGDGELWLALTALAIPVAVALGMDPLQARHVTADDCPHLADAWKVIATLVLCGVTSRPQVIHSAKVARFATHAANVSLAADQIGSAS